MEDLMRQFKEELRKNVDGDDFFLTLGCVYFSIELMKGILKAIASHKKEENT